MHHVLTSTWRMYLNTQQILELLKVFKYCSNTQTLPWWYLNTTEKINKYLNIFKSELLQIIPFLSKKKYVIIAKYKKFHVLIVVVDCQFINSRPNDYPVSASPNFQAVCRQVYYSVFSERELTFTFAICYRPFVCRLSSVTSVRPTEAVQIFGNISTALGTLAIHWHLLKISRRSSQGNPSAGGVKHKRGRQA